MQWAIYALVVLAALPAFAGDEARRVEPDLTLHEWGTFTSVAGEDGSAIEWDTLGPKNDLPKFVIDFGYRGFKWRLPGTVRMETPVMYFYTPREMTVSVKVAFPKGVITEWYPEARSQVYQRDRSGASWRLLPANLNGINTSMFNLKGAIEWKDVKIEPETSPQLPMEGSGSRYYAARETDSAPLGVGDQHEKFLFYRGVARLQVPISARVLADGDITVENRGSGQVPGVILFENYAGRVGYRNVGNLEQSVTLGSLALNDSLEDLKSELELLLVAQGLFPKEAHAMVETWRDSWFEEGSRLIYILPAHAVNAMLPLDVDPAPAARVRVFVGRVELITPETKQAVEAAVAGCDRGTIERYRRFLDPILRRMYGPSPSKADEIELSLADPQVPAAGSACRLAQVAHN